VSIGLVPSLCTACYREGRSGETFRHLAENETIKNFCQENAVLSLKEYMEDCASGEVKEQLKKMLKTEIAKSKNGLEDKFRTIEQGKRDVHI